MKRCVRVYNNNDKVVADVPDDDVEAWIEGNKLWRFGCALFVNGECKAVGYLGEARCKLLSETLEKSSPIIGIRHNTSELAFIEWSKEYKKLSSE